MGRRKKKTNTKEPVLIVFVVLIISFFMFNCGYILYEVNTYSGNTTAVIKKVETIEAKQRHKTGYKITVDYEFQGEDYKNEDMTYFPKLKKFKGQVGDIIDISVNKNDHNKAMYDIWGDNNRMVSLITSIVFILAIIFAYIKLCKIMSL